MIVKELSVLLETRGYPAVSLLCPIYRTYPESRQNRVRLQNLLRSATARLLEEFPWEQVRPLVRRLETYVATVNPRACLDGIAIYANAEWGTVVHLPLAVRERVVIDETFATRDLVLALGRRPRYRVLALGERVTRLYEGVGSGLSEVSQERFSLGPAAEPEDRGRPPRGDRGMDRKGAADERRRHGLRAVDEVLAELNSTDPLPLIVVGSTRALATFQAVSRGGLPVVSTVTLAEDSPPPDQLAARVEPLIGEWTRAQEAELLGALEDARWAGRALTGLQQVWTAARQGRVDSLLVEEGFHYPARVASDGSRLTAAEDATAPDVVDDAIDELIEEALGKGARVALVSDGALGEYAHVAAILRY